MLLGIFSIKVGLMEAGANMVRSWLKMTKVEKIFEKEKEEAMKETRSQAEKDKAMEIAKNCKSGFKKIFSMGILVLENIIFGS